MTMVLMAPQLEVAVTINPENGKKAYCHICKLLPAYAVPLKDSLIRLCASIRWSRPAPRIPKVKKGRRRSRRSARRDTDWLSGAAEARIGGYSAKSRVAPCRRSTCAFATIASRMLAAPGRSSMSPTHSPATTATISKSCLDLASA
jgi:hypothetical protein